ncbi:MAG: hypothetical protein KDD06_26340 [Phaeodactylibacter sp.]|nr:hypothetical protein [Phaeodactylibacter sp.]MCB9265750.1 hypothetical protein [Lewinellaceae bacterium]MCB9285826.1 hypothetical protein [Lewinellaceae bacterium]
MAKKKNRIAWYPKNSNPATIQQRFKDREGGTPLFAISSQWMTGLSHGNNYAAGVADFDSAPGNKNPPPTSTETASG